MPTLIVNGADDHPYVDSADHLAASLPDARHTRIPGADHLSCVTSPAYKKVVLEFLETGMSE